MARVPGVETAGATHGLDEDLLARCVHCGLCLESCPTFVVTGNEADSPRGRLLLLAGLAGDRWGGEGEVAHHLDRCLGCRACERACPSGVAYGELLEAGRAITARHAPRNHLERWLVRHVLWRAGLLVGLVVVTRALAPWWWGRRVAAVPWFPASLRRLGRLLPRPEPTPAHRTPVPMAGPPGPAVLLLRGCVARALFPRTEDAMQRLLAHAGYDVQPLSRPSCCGALAHHLGERDLALRFARELLHHTEGDALVVTTAAGCTAHIKELGRVFPPGAEGERARALARRTRDLTETLLAAPRPLRFQEGPPRVVAYQDACHLRHGQGIVDPPRELLRRAGATLCEVEEGDLCCGSAGTYNVGVGELGEALGRRKAERLRATGADVVASANPGCLIQLEAYLQGTGIDVVSLARFLAARLEAGDPR